jgi:nascent polypeptide-associated complex subunit alpha
MTLDDGGGILLESPQVIKLLVQGQETWQIIGTSENLSPDEMSELMQGEKEVVEDELLEIPEEDVMLVTSQAGVSPEEARAALQQVGGEPARAIMLLKSS